MTSLYHVVYLLIPTSNHNIMIISFPVSVLYIFWFLHQTTTLWEFGIVDSRLYIFWFLHQTTTDGNGYISKDGLYIFWFLHQTTTVQVHLQVSTCCISFDSYIKPQQCACNRVPFLVVYLLIPTSNHNCIKTNATFFSLYIFWFLHQTTTLLLLI